MVLNNILLDVDNVLVGLIYILASFLFFAIGKYAYKVVHKGFDADHELVEKDNFAFAIAQAGYYVGLLLVIGSALKGESNGLINDLIQLGIYATVGIVLLNIGMVISDKLVLPNFKMKKEIIDDQNAGVGAVEAAIAIGTGLILHGIISADHIDFAIVLMDFTIAQLIFVLTSKVYNWITPYNIHEHLEKDNVAVGVGFAGALLAVANILRFAVSGEIESWHDFGLVLVFDVLIALAILPITRFITDKILLPKRSLTDEIINQDHPNVGAALIEAFAYIGGSMLITWCL